MWNSLIGKTGNTSPHKVSRRKAHDSSTRRRSGSTVSASSSKPKSEPVDDHADRERHRMEERQMNSPNGDGARNHKSGLRSWHGKVREEDRREERGKLYMGEGTFAGGARGPTSADVQTDRSGDQAGDISSYRSHSFNAQVGAPSFTQFPGQYNSLPPDLRPPQPPANFSSHVVDQFPGQDPAQYSAPFRPPSAFAPPSGYGEAASYYGDQGQSVSSQPGVRPEKPSIIAGSQPHLMSPSLVSNHPQDAGNGSAAGLLNSGNTAQLPTRPPRPGVPSGLQSSTQSNTPEETLNSSAPAPTTGPSYAVDATGNNTYHSEPYPVGTGSTGKPNRPDTYNSAPSTSSPSRPGKQSSHSTPTLLAAGAAGLAVGGYTAHHGSHQHTPSPGRNTNNHHDNQADPPPHGQEVMSMQGQRPHRRALRTFIDWWSDYEDVRKMEEYTEYIGVCRGCFDPRTSVWDAPRKHLRRRRSSDSLQTGKGQFGTRRRYDNRVDKERRYNSSDTDSRRKRKKNHWTSAGLAEFGLAKIGQALWDQNDQFQEANIVRNAAQSKGQTGRTAQVVPPAGSYPEDAKISGVPRDGRPYGRTLHGDVHVGSSKSGGRLGRSVSRSRSGRRNNGLVGPSSRAIERTSVAEPSARHGTHSPSRSPRRRTMGRKDTSPTLEYNNGLFDGWFRSSTGKRQSISSRKKKRFFNFGNSSSSSSDGLAYGSGTGLRQRRNSGKAGTSGDGDVNAAILRLGAAAAALSTFGSQNRNHGRRGADLYVVKEPRSRRESRRSRKKDQMFSSDETEEGWESASDSEDSSSVNSGLAYGDFDYKGSGLARQSTESLLSQSSGTSKWEWRWGSKKKRKKSSIPELRTPMEGAFTLAAADDAGKTLGASPVARHGNALSDSNLPTMQHIDPMPLSDTHNVDYSRRTPGQFSSANSVLPPRPAPVPLQQPQPITPLSTTIYTTQAQPEAKYVTPSGPPVFARAPPPWDAAVPQRQTPYTSSAIPSQFPPRQAEQVDDRSTRAGTIPRRGYSSPAVTTLTKDVATVEVGRGLPGGAIVSSVAHFELISPGVRFDLTNDQAAKEKREGERYRVEAGNANEKRDEVKETERQNRERRERRRVERRERDRTGEEAADRHAQAPTQEAEQESKREKQRQRPQQDRSQLKPYRLHDSESTAQAGDYASSEPNKPSQRSETQKPQDADQDHDLYAAREYRKGKENSAKIAEIARMTTSEIVEDLRGRYNEASPSLAAFFAPPELSSDAKQKPPYNDGPDGDYDLPMYTGPWMTNAAGRHSYSHESKADRSSYYFPPSTVPQLTLQAPTPPPDLATAPKAVPSRSSSPLGRSAEVPSPDAKPLQRKQSMSFDAGHSDVPNVGFTQHTLSDAQPDGSRGTNELGVQRCDTLVDSSSAAIVESTHMPGGFEDDVEKVLREPDAVPSEPQQQGFYQSPYYETVTDLGSGPDVPGTEPTPPAVELLGAETGGPTSRMEKERSAQDDELQTKLSNKERRKRDKAAKRQTIDEDLVEQPRLPNIAKSDDGQTNQADIARTLEPTTSKKSKKQKTSKQNASRKDQAIMPQNNSPLDNVTADRTAGSGSSDVSEPFVPIIKDEKSELPEDSADSLFTEDRGPRIAVPGDFVAAELGPIENADESEPSERPMENVPMKAGNDSQELWEEKQPKKKLKRRSAKYSSPLPGSPLKSEVSYDDYTHPSLGQMDQKSSGRESESLASGYPNEADNVTTEAEIIAVGQDHLGSRGGAAQGNSPVAGNIPNVQATSDNLDTATVSKTPTAPPDTFSDARNTKRKSEGDNEGSGDSASTLGLQSSRETNASQKSNKKKTGRAGLVGVFSGDPLSDSVSDSVSNSRASDDVDDVDVGQSEGGPSQQPRHGSPNDARNEMSSSPFNYAVEQSDASSPSAREEVDEDRSHSSQQGRMPRGKDPDSNATISTEECGDNAADHKTEHSFLGKGAEEDFPPLPECIPSSPNQQPAKTGPNTEVIPISQPMHIAFRSVDALLRTLVSVRLGPTSGPNGPLAGSHIEDADVREQTPLPAGPSSLLQEAEVPANLPPLPASRPSSPTDAESTADTRMPIDVGSIAALPALPPSRATNPVSVERTEDFPPLPATRPSSPLDVGNAFDLPPLPATRPSSPIEVGLAVDLPSLPATRPSTPVEVGRAVDLPSLPVTRPSSPIAVGRAVDLPPLPVTRPSSPIEVGQSIDLPSLSATRPSSPIDVGRAADLPPLPETRPSSPIEVGRAIDLPTLPATRSTSPIEVGSATDLPPLPATTQPSPIEADQAIDLLSSPATRPTSPMEVGSASDTPPLPATSPSSRIEADQAIESPTPPATPPSSGIRVGMSGDRSLLQSLQASPATGIKRAAGPRPFDSENLDHRGFHPSLVPSSQFHTHAEPFIPAITLQLAKTDSVVDFSSMSSHSFTGAKDSAPELKTVRAAGTEETLDPSSSAVPSDSDSYFTSRRANAAGLEAEQRQASSSAQCFTHNVTTIPLHGPGFPYTLEEVVPTLPTQEHSLTFTPPLRSRGVSSTAIPLRFRLPPSPGAVRDLPVSSPSAGQPTSPLSMSRTRHSRPNSTEFKSNEFRPLYLLERNRKAPEVEDILPPLPSSRTTSRSSSAQASDEEYQSALESPDPETDRDEDEWVVPGNKADFLDSQQPTPKAATVPEECLPGVQDYLPLDQVDELLTDSHSSSMNERPAIAERFYTASDLAPSNRAAARSDGAKDSPQQQADHGKAISGSEPLQSGAMSRLHEAIGTVLLGSAAVAMAKDVISSGIHQSSKADSSAGTGERRQSKSDDTGQIVENLAKTESVAAHGETSAANVVAGNISNRVDFHSDESRDPLAEEAGRQAQDVQDAVESWFAPLVPFGFRKGKQTKKGKGIATDSSSFSDSTHKPNTVAEKAREDEEKKAPVFPVTPVAQFPGMVAEIPQVFTQPRLGKSVDYQDTQNNLAKGRPAIQPFAATENSLGSAMTPTESSRDIDTSVTEANGEWPVAPKEAKQGKGRKGKKDRGKASGSGQSTEPRQDSAVAGEDHEAFGEGPPEQMPLQPSVAAHYVVHHEPGEMPQGRLTSPANSVDAQEPELHHVLNRPKATGEKNKKQKKKSSLFESGDELGKPEPSSPSSVIPWSEHREVELSSSPTGLESHDEVPVKGFERDKDVHEQTRSWEGEKLLPSSQFSGDAKPSLPILNFYDEGTSPNALFPETGEREQGSSKQQLPAVPTTQFFTDTTPYFMNFDMLACRHSPAIGHPNINDDFLPSVSGENLSMAQEGVGPEPAETESKALELEAHLLILNEKAGEETGMALTDTPAPQCEPIMDAGRGMTQPVESPSTVNRDDVNIALPPKSLEPGELIGNADEAAAFPQDDNADISEPLVKETDDGPVVDEAAAADYRNADDAVTDNFAVDELSCRRPRFGSSPVAAPVGTEIELATSKKAKLKGKKKQTVDIWAEQEAESTSPGMEAPPDVSQGRSKHIEEPNIGTSTEALTEQSGAMQNWKPVKPKKRDKRDKNQASDSRNDATSPPGEVEAALNSTTFGGKSRAPAKKQKGQKGNKAWEIDWKPSKSITLVRGNVQEEDIDEIAKHVPLPNDEESLPDSVENTTQEQSMNVAKSKATIENIEGSQSGIASSQSLSLADHERPIGGQGSSEQHDDESPRSFSGNRVVEPEFIPLPCMNDDDLVEANGPYPEMIPLPEDESARSVSGILDIEPALIPLPGPNDDELTKANGPSPEMIPLPEDESPRFVSGNRDVEPELIPLPGGNDDELMDANVPFAEMIPLPEAQPDEAENLRDYDLTNTNGPYPEMIPLPEAGPDEVNNLRDEELTDANGPCPESSTYVERNSTLPTISVDAPVSSGWEVDDANECIPEDTPKLVNTKKGSKDQKATRVSDYLPLGGIKRIEGARTAPTLLQTNTLAPADDWTVSSKSTKAKKPKKGISLPESPTQTLDEVAIKQDEIANYRSLTPSEQRQPLNVPEPSLDEKQVQSTKPLKDTINGSAESARLAFDHSVRNQPRAEERAISSKKKSKKDKKGSKPKQTMPWDDDVLATDTADAVVTPKPNSEASTTPEDLDGREVVTRPEILTDVLPEILEQNLVVNEAEAVPATSRQKKDKKGKKGKERLTLNDEPERILFASPSAGTESRFEERNGYFEEAFPEDLHHTEEIRAVGEGDIDQSAVVIASEETKYQKSVKEPVEQLAALAGEPTQENSETFWESSTKKKAKKRNKSKVQAASIPTGSPPKSEESYIERLGAGPESEAVNIAYSQPEGAAVPESEFMSGAANYNRPMPDGKELTVMEDTNGFINQPSPNIQPADIPLPAEDDTLDFASSDKTVTGDVSISISSQEALMQPADIPLPVEDDTLEREESSDKPVRGERPSSLNSQEAIIQPADIPLPAEDEETELEGSNHKLSNGDALSAISSQEGNIMGPDAAPARKQNISSESAARQGQESSRLQKSPKPAILRHGNETVAMPLWEKHTIPPNGERAGDPDEPTYSAFKNDGDIDKASINRSEGASETTNKAKNDINTLMDTPERAFAEVKDADDIGLSVAEALGLPAAAAEVATSARHLLDHPKVTEETEVEYRTENGITDRETDRRVTIAEDMASTPKLKLNGGLNADFVVNYSQEVIAAPVGSQNVRETPYILNKRRDSEPELLQSFDNRINNMREEEKVQGAPASIITRAREEGNVGEAAFSVMSNEAVDLGDSRTAEPATVSFTRPIEDDDAASMMKPGMELESHGNLRSSRKDKRKEKKAKTTAFLSPGEQRRSEEDEALETSQGHRESIAQGGPGNWPTAAKRSKKDKKKAKRSGFSGLEPANDEALTLSPLDTTAASSTAKNNYPSLKQDPIEEDVSQTLPSPPTHAVAFDTLTVKTPVQAGHIDSNEETGETSYTMNSDRSSHQASAESPIQTKADLDYAKEKNYHAAQLPSSGERQEQSSAASPIEELERNPEEIGTELQTSRVDLDFATTVAAGLTGSGFDANVVFDDATFTHRASPPSSALDLSDVDSSTAKRAPRRRRSNKEKPISSIGSQHEIVSQIRLDQEQIENAEALGNHQDFVATLAAGLQNTGFDPDIVLEDPTFHERESSRVAPDHEFEPSAAVARPRRHKSQGSYGSTLDVARDHIHKDDPILNPQGYQEREIIKVPESRAKERATALDDEQYVVKEPKTPTKDEFVDKAEFFLFISRMKDRKGKIVPTSAADYLEGVERSTEPIVGLEDLQASQIALPPTPAEVVKIPPEGVASETKDRVERASGMPSAVETSQDQDGTTTKAMGGSETDESRDLHAQLDDNAYLANKPFVNGQREDGGHHDQVKGPEDKVHTPATLARQFLGEDSLMPDGTEGVSAADKTTTDRQTLEIDKDLVTPEGSSKVAQQPQMLADAVILAAQSLPSKIASIFPNLQRAKRRAPSVISKDDASASTRVPGNQEEEDKQELQPVQKGEKGGVQPVRTRSKELSEERAINSASGILLKDTQAEFLDAGGAAIEAASAMGASVSGERSQSKKSKQQRKRRTKDTKAPQWAELEAADNVSDNNAQGPPTVTERLETDTSISAAHKISGEETGEMEVEHVMTLPFNRDSAVRVSDSPLFEQDDVSQEVVRDSGYHEFSPSLAARQHQDEQARTQADEDYAEMTETSNSSADPLRISVEFDPKYEISISRQRPRPQLAGDLSNYQQRIHDQWPALVSTSAAEEGADLPQPPLTPARSVEDLGAPSPVESTTEHRTSYLFQSSPSTREVPDSFAYVKHLRDAESEAATGLQVHSDDYFSYAAGLSGALPPEPIAIHSVRGKSSRVVEDQQISQDYRPEPPSDAQAQLDLPSMLPESIVEHNSMESQTKRSRSISEVTPAEPSDRGLKAARRVLSPSQSFRNRVESEAAAGPLSRRYGSEERIQVPTVDSNPTVLSKNAREAHLGPGFDSRGGFDSPTLRRSDQRSVSSHSVRSSGNVSHYSVGEHFRPLSGHSNRSGTPPLRRVSRNVSGDLRATSRLREGRAANSAGQGLDPRATSTTDSPLKLQGIGHAEDMVNFHEGWAGVQGSPLSPTRDRPPSVGKRQSMQTFDLQSHLDQLTAENRLLQDAKAQAERNASEANYQCEVDAQALAAAGRMVESRDRELRLKDEEIAGVKENLRALQEELARLREVNEGLTTANKHLSADTDERYATLQKESSAAYQKWQQSARELEALKAQHGQLVSGMEEIVRQEIANALEDRNLEVQRIRRELEVTREQIRTLQQQILASKAKDDYLVARDEDYFDSACQQLCQHVQQWVLRFSKLSDNKMCRLTSQLRDDKIEARLEDAILDGSDVDTYLVDRIQRRDVFMSVVMKMIWEYIFTRYLFGMDRDQRHKLKMLEKTLSEVGPPRAVAHWRATTLTLLSRRPQFLTQRAQDTEAVAQEIYTTLSMLLPPPPALSGQIMDSLRNLLKIAVTLSIEMRTQRAEYIMLPPLQPDYDPNTGMLTRKVFFNASLMNERSGDPGVTTNEDLERRGAVLRLVLFPLVVKKGDDVGEGDEEIVVAPAQVLIARPTKDRKVVRVMSGALEIERPRSIGTEMSGLESGMI